ncbi:MAG: hypothetical protein O7G85_02660 [Planctomycetota bacterium]|nr:hypothetical protein [Planctomycetota bacterium]
MDFMDPGPLISGALISLVGLAIFLYGKKMEDFKSIGIGLAMMTYPIFIHSVLLMWLIAAICIAGMYLLPRNA